MQGLADLNRRPVPLGDPGTDDGRELALLRQACRNLLGAIERDNTTTDLGYPEDETWIGHCGVEVREVARLIGVTII